MKYFCCVGQGQSRAQHCGNFFSRCFMLHADDIMRSKTRVPGTLPHCSWPLRACRVAAPEPSPPTPIPKGTPHLKVTLYDNISNANSNITPNITTTTTSSSSSSSSSISSSSSSNSSNMLALVWSTQPRTIPPRSPDLNPIEKFWSWLRRELRRRDLQDYKNKKPCLTKTQYIGRVKQVLQTATAQRKAANIARGFRKVCKEVRDKGGAAARS